MPIVEYSSSYGKAQMERTELKNLAPGMSDGAVPKGDDRVAFDVDAEKLVRDNWPNNPRNPMNWGKARKWTLIMVIGITNLVA